MGFQEIMSLERRLSMTLEENVDIKIKTNELEQIRNYEKVGALGALPRIAFKWISFKSKHNSSLEFATDNFPSIENERTESFVV